MQMAVRSFCLLEWEWTCLLRSAILSRNKCHVLINSAELIHLSQLKLVFDSAHGKFDVSTRPKVLYIIEYNQ